MAESWPALVKEEDGKLQTEDEPRGRDKKVKQSASLYKMGKRAD